MVLAVLPRIDRLTLAEVTTVPAWHPEHATFAPFPVHAWVVHHPDGIVLVDTGIGFGNAFVDEHYRPRARALADALAAIALTPSDITAVVLSHLHFDHCGQVGTLDAPVYVQRAELDAAAAPGYTVPEWAAIASDRVRAVDGDAEIADGIRLVATPGQHTRPSVGGRRGATERVSRPAASRDTARITVTPLRDTADRSTVTRIPGPQALRWRMTTL